MQPPPQLAISAQLDENVFVQRQADKVEGLLDWITIVGVGHIAFVRGVICCFWGFVWRGGGGCEFGGAGMYGGVNGRLLVTASTQGRVGSVTQPLSRSRPPS